MTACISRKKEATDEGGLEIWGGRQGLHEESLVGSERGGVGHRRR